MRRSRRLLFFVALGVFASIAVGPATAEEHPTKRYCWFGCLVLRYERANGDRYQTDGEYTLQRTDRRRDAYRLGKKKLLGEPGDEDRYPKALKRWIGGPRSLTYAPDGSTKYYVISTQVDDRRRFYIGFGEDLDAAKADALHQADSNFWDWDLEKHGFRREESGGLR